MKNEWDNEEEFSTFQPIKREEYHLLLTPVSNRNER